MLESTYTVCVSFYVLLYTYVICFTVGTKCTDVKFAVYEIALYNIIHN